VIEIQPSGALSGRIVVPGSKYQANRALILAALSQQPCVIHPVPDNDDIFRVQEGLRALGAHVTKSADRVEITPFSTPSTMQSATLFAGASGTFARFALALASIGSKPITVDGTARLRERPMSDLAQALRTLGAKVEGQNDALPLTVTGPLRGGRCELPGHISSQFVSALLMVAPFAQHDIEIVLTSTLVSRNYVDMTITMMRALGVEVKTTENGFFVRASQTYRGGEIKLEADPCSASYFMAAAALTGGDIELPGFNFDSVQGEAQFWRVLEKMGVKIDRTVDGIRVSAKANTLRGVDVDMGDLPDVVQTLAILAANADGVTRIHNIGHLVHKESNRIFDTALELKKMGVHVEATADSLVIVGGKPHGALIETHHDHRMGMSFAIAGLKTADVKLDDENVVNKSFPQFWQSLQSLGVKLTKTGAV
jgi:3-phosphoshikimate 1-carboxyvinyltransferase